MDDFKSGFRASGSSVEHQADGLFVDDWRGPTRPLALDARGSGKAKQAVHSLDRMHRNCRPSDIAKERERASELIEVAKSVVLTTFDDARFGRRINVGDLREVVEGVSASVSRCANALTSVTRLKSAHEYTYLHSLAVCGLMIAVARELEIPDAMMPEIGMAGLLHDVGKAFIPLSLLDKPGPLDLDEYAVVQQHTGRGHELMLKSGVKCPVVLDVVLHHHERLDGGGYPAALSAPDISLDARIGAVCDVYDAVTSKRSYKQPWSPGAALEFMSGRKDQFDGRVLNALKRVIGVFPIGSLVLLESGRLAIIVNEPAERPTCPDACIFYCTGTSRDIPRDLVNTRNDPVIALEAASRWSFTNFEQRRDDILRCNRAL